MKLSVKFISWPFKLSFKMFLQKKNLVNGKKLSKLNFLKLFTKQPGFLDPDL